MTTLYAQPYDITATGFYFDNKAECQEKATQAVNSYGQPVEEFEIQFIDGEGIDCQLFTALRVSQGEISSYFAAVANWSEDEKIKVIIAVGEAGYTFDLSSDSPDIFDVELYECANLRDLAAQLVDEGLFGDIPARIQCYLDYDSIARDLGMDYGQIAIDGTRYVYRCD